MKATLTKKIEIKSATAYLVFEKEQERKDIQKFLNGEEFEDETINERVKEYLRNLQITDENDIPTQKGNRIRQTGKMFVREEGKYKIWFAENDNFLGTKILYFERIAPRENERVDILNVSFQEENYFLPINDNKFSNLKLIININDKIAGQINNTNDAINLSWIWEDLEKSHYVFVGQINRNNIKPHSINLDKDLNEFISKTFPDWDKKQNRLKIQFRNLQEDKERTNFVTNYTNKNQRGFDTIEFLEIPIMPYDTGDAIIWRNWLVEQELNRDYYLKYDFENLIKTTNRKEGFSAYYNSLDIPVIENYRNEIFDKDRSKQSPAFWHLAAPSDLNPDISIEYSDETLDYPVEEQITFEQICDNLKRNTKHQINAVFYYDKYVYTPNQQNAMKAFFDCFDCPTKILITDNKQTRSNFLQKNASEIKQFSLKDVFLNQKAQHDRYIALCENKDTYTLWKTSNMLDCINLEKETVIDSFSLQKIDKKVAKKGMLKFELQTFIESKI
ncbi:MAG: hypothetical protein JJT94_17820 [Bernardetiaceae bacterium]|nr:hypothetical protein [Bernardetiaceae bacterium]